jgi:hypothetical protein
MRELGVLGAIAIAFGLGAGYATGVWGAFSVVNLVLGTAATLAALVLGLRRARGAGAPAFRGVVLRGLGRILLALLLAVAAERAVWSTGWRFDGSFERRFEPAPATVEALRDLAERSPGEGPGVRATLYREDFDPRVRATRILLRVLADTGWLRVEDKRLAEHPEDEDRFAIGSSNTVVLQRLDADGRPLPEFETVERPTEGALYEALYRLRELGAGTLWVAGGAGEGDLERSDAGGYSGLAAALQTEGYALRRFVSAALQEIPDEATAVLWIAPRRPLREETREALHRYLGRGGRLVAFLEPDVDTGLEAVLARWGLASPEALLVDPASGPIEGMPAGTAPLVHNFASHPVTRGLGPNRMAFLRGTRAFELTKPRIEDELDGVALSSVRAWLSPDVGLLEGGETPERPPEARTDYWPVVATGRYERGAQPTRIVAFGDADLASNRYLRTLYNLDLVLNAVHWVAEREPAITLRPKAGVTGRMQFPIPLENTLTMFQSLGLVLPELLLLAGAFVWLRGRAA